MEKRPTRFDRMREENEALKPQIKKELSDKAAEAVARTLKFFLTEKKEPPKTNG